VERAGAEEEAETEARKHHKSFAASDSSEHARGERNKVQEGAVVGRLVKKPPASADANADASKTHLNWYEVAQERARKDKAMLREHERAGDLPYCLFKSMCRLCPLIGTDREPATRMYWRAQARRPAASAASLRARVAYVLK
jgi:hypothetical protein